MITSAVQSDHPSWIRVARAVIVPLRLQLLLADIVQANMAIRDTGSFHLIDSYEKIEG